MLVAKQQIVDGFSSYISNEIIDKISDRKTKVFLGTVVFMLKTNPKFIDKLFDNQLVNFVMADDDSMYDVGTLLQAMSQAVDQYGVFDFTIPSIITASKTEKVLTFSSNDILKLKDYIERGDEM